MDTLIDQVYEAAMVPDRWPGLLANLGKQFETKGGLIFSASADGTRWLGGGAVVEIMQEFLAAGWMTHNDRPTRVLARNHPGFLTELDIMTEAETRHLPMFAEFLRPKGCFATAGTFIAGLDSDKMIFSIEGFADHQAARAAVPALDALRPHLARAVQLASQFKLERMKGHVEALQAIGAAACILSSHGVLKVANQRFETELGHLFYDFEARLTLADRRADEQLVRAVARVRNGVDAGCSIVVRCGGGPARVLHIVPVIGQAMDLFINASVLLVLTNPSTPTHFSTELIQQLFDLTPAEAKLTSLVGTRSATLQQIATDNGLSINTVKSQIKSVFEKTGTERQADLVRLLMTFVTIQPASGTES
jgi:DNA-binding CsgD family transcriptional regulator